MINTSKGTQKGFSLTGIGGVDAVIYAILLFCGLTGAKVVNHGANKASEKSVGVIASLYNTVSGALSTPNVTLGNPGNQQPPPTAGTNP